MKKIAMVSSHFSRTGISSIIMNYCRNINKEEFEITIFAGNPIDNAYKKECKELGVKIVKLPNRHKKKDWILSFSIQKNKKRLL